MELYGNINELSGVGKKRAELYEKLEILTNYDLIKYFPKRYLDYSNAVNINEVIVGETNVIRAFVTKKNPVARIRQGLTLYKLSVSDGTENVSVIFYNNRFAYEELKTDTEYFFCGKINQGYSGLEMNSPTFISINDKDLIKPVYRLTQGLTSKMVITNMNAVLPLCSKIPEILPEEIRNRFRLCDIDFAYKNVHFPLNEQALNSAKRRLFFDEMLTLQLGMMLIKTHNVEEVGYKYTENTEIFDEYLKVLPFEMTGAQIKASKEIISDMQKNTPMNRLVQGDVGSGKTVVAAAAAVFAWKNGYQSALMAPTEILARQHFNTLSELLSPMGIKCCLVVGGLTAKNRREVDEDIANGKYDVVIGTHALISDSTEFHALSLVIMDEQHRFGVNQRAKLAAKGKNPHKLVMSATPIPRTLALIIYGDLDISILNELPKGRQKIDTFAVTDKLRERAFGFVKEQLDNGRQGYMICPMIDENANELVSVKSYAKNLSDGFFKNYKIGILHGKLTSAEKSEIMLSFSNHEIDLLVSTTVVEVGVDVPNATIILIENAEKFGLSQLHQLRGRVGRGKHKSYCILVAGKVTDENKKRLKVMSETSDGFKISEYDLKLRGAGDFFGERQHGLPKTYTPENFYDSDVLVEVREAAEFILKDGAELSAYPKLKENIDKMLGSSTL